MNKKLEDIISAKLNKHQDQIKSDISIVNKSTEKIDTQPKKSDSNQKNAERKPKKDDLLLIKQHLQETDKQIEEIKELLKKNIPEGKTLEFPQWFIDYMIEILKAHYKQYKGISDLRVNTTKHVAEFLGIPIEKLETKETEKKKRINRSKK